MYQVTSPVDDVTFTCEGYELADKLYPLFDKEVHETITNLQDHFRRGDDYEGQACAQYLGIDVTRIPYDLSA